MNAALSGLVVWGVGCIIPTPLDQATQQPNFTPVFVTSKVQPAFGPLGPLTQTQAISIALVASDANLEDTLSVRLFELINGSYVATGQQSAMAYPNPPDDNPDNASLRYTTFDFTMCRGATAGQHLIYAVVADRNFGTGIDVPGGLADSNHWDVSCM